MRTEGRVTETRQGRGDAEGEDAGAKGGDVEGGDAKGGDAEGGGGDAGGAKAGAKEDAGGAKKEAIMGSSYKNMSGDEAKKLSKIEQYHYQQDRALREKIPPVVLQILAKKNDEKDVMTGISFWSSRRQCWSRARPAPQE